MSWSFFKSAFSFSFSASNAETWNSIATIFKGMKWMLQKVRRAG